MSKAIFSISTFLIGFCFQTFSQNTSGNFYSVYPVISETIEYNKNAPIYFTIGNDFAYRSKLIALKDVKKLEDLIPQYPKNWISEEEKLTMTLFNGQKEIVVQGSSTDFSKEQISLLQKAQINDVITLNLHYKAFHDNNEKVLKKLTYHIKVIPEMEATSVVAIEKLKALMLENMSDDLKQLLQSLTYTSNNNNENQEIQLSFVVNTDGLAKGIKVVKSSGNHLFDEELKQILGSTTQWIPATDTGKKVPQEMTLTFNSIGC